MCNIYPKKFPLLINTSPSNGIILFSAVLSLTSIKRDVRCTPGNMVHNKAHLWWNERRVNSRLILPDDFSPQLLPLHRDTRSVTLIYVLRMLMCLCSWPRVRELECVTPKELENTLRTRILMTPDNKGTIIAAVGREQWRSSRDFARKPRLPEPTGLDLICDEF